VANGLSALRVLDITDHRGVLAGRLLADFGADVIQLEPPEGCDARRMPPFDDSGNSLYWACYGASKRSVVCNSQAPGFTDLLATADILLRTATPDMPSYDALHALNPRLVCVTTSPFGLDGPKSAYADAEIVLWAAGGALYGARDEGRVPTRVSVPQAYLHAAADAAVGALLACQARHHTGRGQHVEISVQQSVTQATLSAVLAHAINDTSFQDEAEASNAAGGADRLDLSGSGSASRRSKTWQVRDGLVELHLAMGPATGRFTNNLFAWMAEKGALDPDMAAWDWSRIHQRLLSGEMGPADIDRARDAVAHFLARFTRRDLTEAAIARKLLIAPRLAVCDLAESPQVAARDVLRSVAAHRIVGPPVHIDGAPIGTIRPAPALGADTTAVFSAPPPPTPEATPRPPFDGLKILDLSWVVAGPMVGRVLADFGATVVRVECARRMDAARVIGPFTDSHRGPEHSAVYQCCNAGKLGVTLDLSLPAARDILTDLISWADVLLESYAPGAMARWGLDWPTLHRLNPGLILVSSTLLGQTGPYSQFAGFGNLGSCMAGVQHLVGWPGRPARGPFGPYTDYLGPRFALVALMAALDQRRGDGIGHWIDVAQAECGMYFLAPALAECCATGRVAAAQGNADAVMAPHGVYLCAPDEPRRSRFVAIAVPDDAAWSRLAALIGAQDPRWQSAEARRADTNALDALISTWTADHTARDVEATLQAQGIPAHVVASSRDICEDAQLTHAGYLQPKPHPTLGTTPIEATRYRLSATPARTDRAAPLLGEHNEAVLSGMLGLSSLEALKEAGVLS
jgi:crotonobetainyl-CoA:carnitine CoA-transferase CaiB-like acyl-CoA transferase